MEGYMKSNKLYFVICCILLHNRISYSGKHYKWTHTHIHTCTHILVVEHDVELQPSSEYVEVCSGTTVQINCTTGTDDLYWSATPECQVSYDKDDTALVGVGMRFCDFKAILLSTSPSLMSTATLSNVNSSHNGTVLICQNTIVPVNLGPDQMASISIFVRGNYVNH